MDGRRILLKTAIDAIVPLDSHTYHVDLPLDHCFVETAHGGLLASLIHTVSERHFQTTLRKYNQPHTFNLHIMFLRPATAGHVILKIQDTKPGPGMSIMHVTLSQAGKDRAVAYTTNVNMEINQGVSYDTGYQLNPEPAKVDLRMLETGSESRWVGWGFPWHFQSVLKAHTHIRSFVPKDGPPRPNVTDLWLTPSSTHDSFITQTLGSVVDFWHRTPENNLSTAAWSNASIVRTAQQVAEGSVEITDIGRNPPPHWYPTLSMNLEIKKLLPPGGVKWLFIRAQTKEVQRGRMDAEVMIFDRHMELVALSHQICFVIENAEVSKQENGMTKGKL